MPIYAEVTRAACPKWQEYIQRFHVVARFLSPKLIEEHLHSMERSIYTQTHADREIVRMSDQLSNTSDSSSNTSDSSEETSEIPEIVVSNPRKRIRKSRKQNINNA